MCVITVPPFPVTNCRVPENFHTPPTEEIGLSWGIGEGECSARPKNLKKFMKLNWNYQRGEEGGA